MRSYTSLAASYDDLTYDVPYSDFLKFYKNEFHRAEGQIQLVLDLCCGTGTMTKLLYDEGYDVIGVDSSEDMLMKAREKLPDILLLCQDAADLDLYGTVDACISSLDSINYIKPSEFKKLLRKLSCFIRPKGIFIFDIRPEKWLAEMDGYTSVDENEDILCLWRADFDKRKKALNYSVDIFERDGEHWLRNTEDHTEYVYDIDSICAELENNNFTDISVIENNERFFISALRK